MGRGAVLVDRRDVDGAIMSSSDAQKSEVHRTTDDSSTSPGSNARQDPNAPGGEPAPMPGQQQRQDQFSAAPPTSSSSAPPSRGDTLGAGSMTNSSSARRRGAPEPDRSQFPPSNYEIGAAEADRRPVDEGADVADVTQIGGGPGASDSSSGGGGGAGIPGGGSDMRSAGFPPLGDADEDREKLFPEADAS